MPDRYGVARRRPTPPSALPPNPHYDPELQVPLPDVRAARDVIARMLDGGEPLCRQEVPPLRDAIRVLDEAIRGAQRRALR